MHRPGYVQGGQEANRGYLLLGVHHRRIHSDTVHVDQYHTFQDPTTSFWHKLFVWTSEIKCSIPSWPLSVPLKTKEGRQNLVKFFHELPLSAAEISAGLQQQHTFPLPPPTITYQMMKKSKAQTGYQGILNPFPAVAKAGGGCEKGDLFGSDFDLGSNI